jgi:prepilin-type N-terminal cleavage/methylation domain-containing protein
MCNSISSEKGMTLIEVMIAVMLVSIGALSLLATQGPAWNLTGRSDILGRAGMVLHRELGANELLLMNPNVANPCLAVNPLVNVRNVNASDQAVGQPGDIVFTVQNTTRDNLNGTWTVRVQVAWPGNNVGVSESVVVTRQEPFRF